MKTAAVIGSSAEMPGSDKLAEEIGIALAKRGFSLVTGAGPGLPLKAAMAAKKAGALVLGISPSENAVKHKESHQGQPEVFDFLVYTGFGQKGRNPLIIRSADVVIMVGGGLGTLNEFTIAYDEDKVIGVLEGSGGASDRVRELTKLSVKRQNNKIRYSNDPNKLIDEVDSLVSKG
jgi:uncharacterized protein (TIGR00725 family)